MTKITKREKMLLVFMLLGILVYGGFYLVKIPLDDEYEIAETAVRNKESELATVQNKIASKADLEITLQETQADFAEIQKRIRPYMQDEDLDNRMVTIMEANGIASPSVLIANDAGRSIASEIDGITYKGYGIEAYATADNLFGYMNALYKETDLAIIGIDIERDHGLSDGEIADLGVEVDL
ncbi:MAG: hypothetical protein R3Y54_10080 [Eubacteriales bacterium]